MANKNTLTLLLAAIITSFGLFISPAFAATPGTWVGEAEFGTFSLVVNAQGAGIEQIDYQFSAFACVPDTTAYNITVDPGVAWPISNGEFSITRTLHLPTEMTITISGAFESATQAAGTWNAEVLGEQCTGTWETPGGGSATPGTWVGEAEFGTFDLEVNVQGVGIEKVAYYFSAFTCGPRTLNYGIGFRHSVYWPISNGEFSITVIFSGDSDFTVSGTFESATLAAGTWEARFSGEQCTGTWEATIDGGVDPEPFQINAGHSGAWFNPDTSGQGQLIDVEPEEQFMFVAWFTYTAAASNNPFEQRWLTAQGNYSGNTAELPLYETLGGRFDDPQAVTNTQIGEVTLSFDDCDQGQLIYSLDAEGLQGSFPLNRVIPGSGNVCEERSGNTTQAVDINAGMDGAWFDPNTSGQGFLIDAHPNPAGGNFIFVAWFTYGDDTASGQRWLTAQGSFEGSMAEIDVFEASGGSFDDPQPVSMTNVGTMSLDFTDCSDAQLSYSLPAESAMGDIAITRVIPGGQALCEELAGAE